MLAITEPNNCCEISGSHVGEYEWDVASCSLIEIDRRFRDAYFPTLGRSSP
jgi:hypothetical protein